MSKSLKERRTYSDSFVIFWIAYLCFGLICLSLDQTLIFLGATIAVSLTTPLRDRWL